MWTSWKNGLKEMRQKSNRDRCNTVNLGRNGEQWITKKICRKSPEVYDLSLVEHQTQYHAIIKNYISYLGFKNSSQCQINMSWFWGVVGGQLACPLWEQVWPFIFHLMAPLSIVHFWCLLPLILTACWN